ncbi:MAG: hypothetical protein KC470_12355 [Dehalococcoidia bacterium]|nr:hypothetical protein [Dehalococcoidia bacterium]
MNTRTIIATVVGRSEHAVQVGTFETLELEDGSDNGLLRPVVLCFRDADFAPAVGTRVSITLLQLPIDETVGHDIERTSDHGRDAHTE